ncbi:MAG: NeuD/PglB/VioB family sugar acetyltransferase [Phycisphaerales bacterium]|nr:NeuD/PglB/VioB family sugar acetyltransferase [Phycisphaerales bacterium]
MDEPNEQRALTLIGGGGHALVVGEAARRAGFSLAGVYDDDASPAALRLGVTRLGSLNDVDASGGWIIALGNLAARAKVIERLGSDAARVIHPGASVEASATLGAGTYAGPRCVVHSFAVVGAHAIINTAAVIEHECELESNVHVAPGAVLGGRVRVGSGSLVGIGARVLPGVRIGRGVVIGAGCVVIRDVPDGARVVGVPARELGKA